MLFKTMLFPDINILNPFSFNSFYMSNLTVLLCCRQVKYVPHVPFQVCYKLKA